MYYLLYGFIYLLSRLPWSVLYVLSDLIYLLTYYVIGYRRGVVMQNLLVAFPYKSDEQRLAIAKKFYHNFIDTFIETIKLFSVSDKSFTRRITGNFDLLSDLHKTGKSVQLHSGHFFNWEFINWGISKHSPYPFLGVYAPMSNHAVNRMMLRLRSRYGTILIPSYTFKSVFPQYAGRQYSLGLAADQSSFAHKSYWVNFFGKRTPFVMGPEKGARDNNTAIVFVHFYKIKRSYYHADFKLVTTEPPNYQPGELTKLYVSWLEECIEKKPDNYLWSHRRWKYEYRDEFSDNLIE